MKVQDIFGLIVRIAGLWMIAWGLWNMGEAVGCGLQGIFEILHISEGSGSSDFVYLLVFAIFSPLIGFAILSNADSIVQWSYRERKQPLPPKLDK